MHSEANHEVDRSSPKPPSPSTAKPKSPKRRKPPRRPKAKVNPPAKKFRNRPHQVKH
ncbi:hypothetical protein LCGC14_1517770 [marine sediment metagenome]|uniref:Uncharacterized protein n=1 Tax=marine sediment metagenome TaxID=412755 RepID=A0A0F9LF90_9ZZZZ